MAITELFDVTDKTVVISGACGGIGSALARGFCAAGARVVGADIVERQDKLPAECAFRKTNITDRDSVAKLAEFAANETGRVDVLINTAAIIEGYAPAEDLSVEEYERTLKVNLIGSFLCCQEIGRLMIGQRCGKIINFGSRGGLIGTPFTTPYNTSKAGILLLSKTLAVEWGAYNVYVNTIIPTLVRTPLLENRGPDPVLDEIYGGRAPLGRIAEPEDFVGPAIFLASAASNYITGSEIMVDGGNLASGGIGTEVRDHWLRKQGAKDLAMRGGMARDEH